MEISTEKVEKIQKKKERSLWGDAWRRFKKSRMAMAGLFFLLALSILAVATIAVDLYTDDAYYEAHVIKQDMRHRLQAPSIEHPFGLDEFGRDMFMRMIWGIRYSLFLGVFAIGISVVVGGILGAIAGFYKNADNIIMRFMDVLLAIPSTLLAIAIVAALGPSIRNLLIAVSVSYTPTFSRIVRASVLTIKDQEFIEAARAVGASDMRIIFKYIIPNSLAPIIVQATLGVAGAILNIAGLSFLGLGIEPPLPEWGAMLSNARTYIRDSWHITTVPGLGIMLTILALNLVGDGFRDALDPRLKN